MRALDQPDRIQAHHPNDEHRPQVVPPLHAQRRHGKGCQKKQGADAEIGWVPEVPPLHSQDVLRHDGEHPTERVGPQHGRTHEDGYADAGDVGAGELVLLASEEPPQHELRRSGRQDGEGDRLVPAQRSV